MGDTVLYEREGRIATITYNRPEAMNAINGQLRSDLNDAWAQFRDDEEAWVGIVTGAGRAFSAGADLRDANPATPGTFWEIPSMNSLESGMEIWKPVIAAVNGYCLGFALTLVAACDFVIASERAEFGFPEVRIGVPTIQGAVRMPARIGWQNAMELLLIGERVDAHRAKEMGLAWKAVPDDAVFDEAAAAANRIAELPHGAVRDLKRVLNRAGGIDIEGAIALEADATVRAFLDPEAAKRVKQFTH